MRPSNRSVYNAIIAHWDSYQKPPSRQWLQQYTGLSSTTVYHAVRYLASKGLIYAPKHRSYIAPKVRPDPKPREPWDQEPVYA